MCIAGYLIPRRRRAAARPRHGDELGIKAEGPVMRGEKLPEEQRAAEAMRAVRSDGEFYARDADYDPVLKSHCRG